MNILYITNVPIPKNRETDAHFQELDLLVSTFGGEIISAFPLSSPSSIVPRSLYGLHNWKTIKAKAKEADLIHIFSPSFHAYNYIKKLTSKPIIYSSLTPLLDVKPIRGVDHYVVYDEDSLEKLKQHGGLSASLSPPYVHFDKTHLELPEGPFTLLMASAPWEEKQFETKGIHLLLEAVKNNKDLRLILIWRDILFDKMKKLIAEAELADRIELVNERVEIKDYLKRSHAVVLLAKFSSLVKSYPHSLMEGLLAGRPVLTSQAIPMSTEIERDGLGVVMNEFNSTELNTSLVALQKYYKTFRQNTLNISDDLFNQNKFIELHRALYTKTKV